MMLRASRSLAARTTPALRAAFATEAVTDVNPWEELRATAVDMPLTLFGLNARFANAAFSQASRHGDAAVVEKELKNLQTILNNEEVRSFAENPTVATEDKLEAMAAVAEEQKYSEVTRSLVETVTEGGRLGKLSSIIDVYGELMSAQRGEVTATVTSAADLTKGQKTSLEKAVKARAAGKAITVTYVVDESILGGLMVELGDEFADLSVASSLDELSTALLTEE